MFMGLWMSPAHADATKAPHPHSSAALAHSLQSFRIVRPGQSSPLLLLLPSRALLQDEGDGIFGVALAEPQAALGLQAGTA